MRRTNRFHPVKILSAIGYFLGIYFLAFAMIIGMTPAAVSFAQSGSGAIWTTRDTCGDPDQNVNHYQVGDVVYVNASNFDPNESMAWDITKVSGNPKVTIATGNVTANGSGAFCIAAYTILPTTPSGTYQVTVGDVKSDNFRIQAQDPTPTNTAVPPTDTPLPTDVPTNTPVPPTDTPIPTEEPTNTPVPPTNTPLPTDVPTNTPLPPTNTPEPTATSVPPTATSQPTEIAPTSPAPTATSAPTNPPPDPTDVPAPQPTSPAVLIPVTGINVGGSRVLMEGLLVDLGIGFLGFGLLMHGVWHRFGKDESGLIYWEDPKR